MEKKIVSEAKEKVSSYVPDDIAFSILSKLPLKSLKRFECVRKSWSLLFENHHFMNMFRNNFLSNSHHCSSYDGASLVLKSIESNQKVLYSLSGEKFENKIKLECSNPFENDENYFQIFGFGSINGTFCLHENDNYCQIVLWNPAIQEFKLIPPSPIESVESSIPNVAKDLLSVFVMSYLHGFGYDDLINDYKVIRYVCIMGKDPCYGDISLGGLGLGDKSLDPFWEIYSLRSNSWRKLDVDIPYSLDGIEGTHVYMDGVCHWLCEDSPVGPCLVSFYLSNEVFFITPLPSDVDDWFDAEALWINLSVLNGSIALISYHEETTTFNISILGELSIKESWTKLLIVGPLPCVGQPIGVGTKGEIFFIRNDEELAWLDLSTQMIVELGYKGVFYGSRIVIYMESILPVRGISN